MRLLIANHIDAALLNQIDQRMFVHRMLWLSKPGDVIVLPCAPDLLFVEHVAKHIGFNPASLRFIDLSIFCEGDRLFQDDALTKTSVLDKLQEIANEITEILPLWPSPQVARMAQVTGLTSKLPGCLFFAQAGDEFSNSKANFRRISAGIGIMTASGAVCRTVQDAVQVSQQLLAENRAIVVKQSTNHAGAGNMLIVLQEEPEGFSGGFRYRVNLNGQLASLSELFDDKWGWASCNGTNSVTIEAFVENIGTVYAEFMVRDAMVDYIGSGTLCYKEGRLTTEAAPLYSCNTNQLASLLDQGRKLAQAYQALGYRGYFSADAVSAVNGSIVFTEVNARIGGSPHIYHGIANRVVRCERQPDRIVTQHRRSLSWNIKDTRFFLDVIAQTGLEYDPQTRRGVLMSTPPFGGEDPTPPFFVCIVHKRDEDSQQVMANLDKVFDQLKVSA